MSDIEQYQFALSEIENGLTVNRNLFKNGFISKRTWHQIQNELKDELTMKNKLLKQVTDEFLNINQTK